MRRRREVPWWLPMLAALLFLLMIATLWAMGTGRVKSRHGAHSHRDGMPEMRQTHS